VRRDALGLLLGVTGFVLLIACATSPNLLLGPIPPLERHEMAVRCRSGASRRQLSV
jgi:hypothetical protein